MRIGAGVEKNEGQKYSSTSQSAFRTCMGSRFYKELRISYRKVSFVGIERASSSSLIVKNRCLSSNFWCLSFSTRKHLFFIRSLRFNIRRLRILKRRLRILKRRLRIKKSRHKKLELRHSAKNRTGLASHRQGISPPCLLPCLPTGRTGRRLGF